MIGRWRNAPPTKILRRYLDELRDRVKQFDKDINELRWEKKAIIDKINWIERKMEKEKVDDQG